MIKLKCIKDLISLDGNPIFLKDKIYFQYEELTMFRQCIVINESKISHCFLPSSIDMYFIIMQPFKFGK